MIAAIQHNNYSEWGRQEVQSDTDLETLHKTQLREKQFWLGKKWIQIDFTFFKERIANDGNKTIKVVSSEWKVKFYRIQKIIFKKSN